MNRPIGWLGDNEGKELQEITKSISPNGIIIEIGTWQGLSTSYIADVISNEQTLITIDNYLDNSEAFEVSKIRPIEARHKFQEYYFHERYFKKKIISIVGSSIDIANLFKLSSSNIDFLFIDGDHKYESVKADYLAWSAFNPTIVAFHDYTNIVDIGRFVNEIKDEYNSFKLVASLAVLKNKK